MRVYTPQVHIAQKVWTIVPQKTKIKFGKHPVIFSPSFDKAVWGGQDLNKPKNIPKAPSFSTNCIRKLFGSDRNIMN